MIPLPIRKQNVISFSGGRTSGLMLRRELDAGTKALIIFCNTGKERNETLDFVEACSKNWGVDIIWLEYCRVPATVEIANYFPYKRRRDNVIKKANEGALIHWFKQVDYTSASRKGEPFDSFLSSCAALPNPTGRGCSAQLKIRTIIRYMFWRGFSEYNAYIGIRKDEEHRAIQISATCEKFLHPKFPLIRHKITERDVMVFWEQQPFDLNLQSYEGNCDLCFLKSAAKRQRLIRDNPGMVDWWIEKEYQFSRAGTGGRFRIDKSYADLLRIAREQEELFSADDFRDIACSCAERGFESSGEDLE